MVDALRLRFTQATPPQTISQIEGCFYSPLNLSGSPLGLLVVGGQDHALTRTICELVAQTLTLMIEEASEKRGLTNETLDRYREINLLYRISETIGATLDPNAILSLVMEEARQIIDADFGLLLLDDADTGWHSAAKFGDLDAGTALNHLTTDIMNAYGAGSQPAIITEFSELGGGANTPVIGSLLWAPLSTPDKSLGGVMLGRLLDRPLFVANDQKLLMALAGQAAIALDKANLFEETETNAQLLQELNLIGRELSGTLELEPLLRQLMRAALDLAKADRGALFLIDESTGELVFSVVEGGDQEHLHGMRLPMGTGIVGQVAESGEPQIVNQVQESEAWFDGIDKHTGAITQSIIAVPMVRQDGIVGVLELIDRRDGKPFRQPDLDRLTAFSAQAVVAMETARLHQADLAKQRMEKELQLGHTMQSSLIPSAVPQMEGWEFAAWWQPAREVSGDYYDFVGLGDQLGVVVADVADKGVQAALFMALTRSTVRTSLSALPTPAAGINAANHLISQDAADGMFVTLCYAQFSPDSSDVTYLNAGHNPPLWLRSAQHEIIELEPTGIFLGFDSGIPFEDKTIRCDSGDIFIFFTDGVTEAMNPARQQYGDERFQALLLQNSHQSPAEMLEQIQQSLQEHTADTVQSDDVTLVIAKRK